MAKAERMAILLQGSGDMRFASSLFEGAYDVRSRLGG
jgi:hypothetical protein